MCQLGRGKGNISRIWVATSQIDWLCFFRELMIGNGNAWSRFPTLLDDRRICVPDPTPIGAKNHCKALEGMIRATGGISPGNMPGPASYPLRMPSGTLSTSPVMAQSWCLIRFIVVQTFLGGEMGRWRMTGLRQLWIKLSRRFPPALCTLHHHPNSTIRSHSHPSGIFCRFCRFSACTRNRKDEAGSRKQEAGSRK